MPETTSLFDDQPTVLGKFPILQVQGMEKNINMLIYAESGVGKTVLCGSAAAVSEMGPVLFIDVEGGTMSLMDFYPNVQVIRIQSWNDMQRLVKLIAKGDHGYNTIVIDSLSECSKLSMQNVMDVEVATSSRDIDPDVPEIRHWGKNIEQMRRFVRTMRDLEVNVLFTALSDKEKDNKGKWQSYPMMPGKLSKEIPGFMDIVCYYYIKSTKREGKDVKQRLLVSTSTDTAVAKDRSNKLPQVMEEPTMAKIYEAIIGTSPAKENK
jgi:hypothetical protein